MSKYQQQTFQKFRKRLYRRYARYEKYLAWLITALIFSILLMWAIKQIFSIYLPFNSWKTLLDSVAILGFLFSLFLAWITDRNNKEQAKQIAIARKQEKDSLILDNHSLELIRIKALEDALWSAINGLGDRIATDNQRREQDNTVLDNHSSELARINALEDGLWNAIAANGKDIDELKWKLGRISAQIDQLETNASLNKKIIILENQLSQMSNMIDTLNSNANSLTEQTNDYY